VARDAEAILERVFAGAPAAEWVAQLRRAGVPAELIEPMDRDTFRHGILDDPVNRQLGRVASFETADWGAFEQIGPLLRCGPDGEGRARAMLPGIGEHTVDVLRELGFSRDEIDTLADAKVVRQL
jgi:crotonobetainyl-CoA:carnitine CoA-transferase CaiB-like acyl-CoA transferase